MMDTKEKVRIQKAFQENLDYDELMNCTRCGFCLPSCPTYVETNNNEIHSPRGRIALMKGVVDGDIEPSEEVKESIDLCLGCRACETACPSGVKFGHLLEQSRAAIYQSNKKSLPEKVARNVAFNHLFPNQNNMINLTNLVGFYQRSIFKPTVRSMGILNFFPEPMKLMEKVLPDISRKKELKNRKRLYSPLHPEKKKVAFFSGCLMDTVFKQTNDSTIKLLQYAGCEIVIPETQACCGALHGHSGEQEKAKSMAKKNIEAFEDSKVDYIITNAGGCGAFLVDYNHLLKDDLEWAERAIDFSSKIKDITKILVELEFDKLPLKLNNQTITYQDSCHLKNGQQTYKEPRQLIKSIQDIRYNEMKNADGCCGSAGIYNIIQPDMSMQILDHKMEQAKNTQANIIVTTNPGCLLQMKVGIEREGLTGKVEATHIVDLLLKAYKNTHVNKTPAKSDI